MSWSTSEASCDDQTEDGEVQGVISLFICVYIAATAKGLKPDASWLRQNPEFR
jgi:hypothetical protein